MFIFSARLEVVVNVLEGGLLEISYQPPDRVTEQRTDYDEVTLELELVVYKTEARVEAGAVQPSTFKRCAPNTHGRLGSANLDWHSKMLHV